LLLVLLRRLVVLNKKKEEKRQRQRPPSFYGFFASIPLERDQGTFSLSDLMENVTFIITDYLPKKENT